MGIANTDRPGSYGYGRNHSKRVHMLADTDLLRAPLPALGVRARTVGDFFVAGQFIGGRRRPCSANEFPMKFLDCCALIR